MTNEILHESLIERAASRARRETPPNGTFYPRAVGRALVQVAKVQTALWDRALRHMEEVQEAQLRDIVRHAADTDFGRRHSFRGVKSYRDFAARVPVGDYDTFSPAIDRMRAGEKNLLVPEFVRYFGNSSGSSNHGKPKFLPIAERQIAHQRRSGADALMRYLAWSGDDTFVRGFTLGLFPPTTMRPEGPVLITSNPALMVTRMPLFTRPMLLPDEECRTMTDYDAKLGVMAERYLDHDVRSLTGTTCWFTLLFDKVLEAAARKGRRARTVSDVWPNLKVLIGGGVSAEPYLATIRERVGRDDVTLVDTYNATEGGIYGSSDFVSTRARGMLMLPHRGTFFEFVPLEDHERADAPRVPLWAVERDRPYAIVVTTTSGLYAYKLGDIVRFPSVDPPRIEFMGRLSGCLSVTQELTTHVEIERAVAHAIERCPCTTVDFGAAADVGVAATAKSQYLLFVEFQTPPADLRAFEAAFDEGLCGTNRVYREHRQVAILPARVVPLVPGGTRKFLDEVTRGNVQGKFPRILDDSKKQRLWLYADPPAKPS